MCQVGIFSDVLQLERAREGKGKVGETFRTFHKLWLEVVTIIMICGLWLNVGEVTKVRQLEIIV